MNVVRTACSDLKFERRFPAVATFVVVAAKAGIGVAVGPPWQGVAGPVLMATVVGLTIAFSAALPAFGPSSSRTVEAPSASLDAPVNRRPRRAASQSWKRRCRGADVGSVVAPVRAIIC
jgi:hypothetical protein